MVARTDLVTDPQVAADLLLARRGTAFFSRTLAGVDDGDLAGPSAVPGWTRAHVVAHVGYQARAVAQALEELRLEGAVPEEVWTASPDDVAFGATLPGVALRHLHAHAAVHLSVEWRDLPPARWVEEVEVGGVRLPVTGTPLLRARTVWWAAVDLAAGARPQDVPAGVGARP